MQYNTFYFPYHSHTSEVIEDLLLSGFRHATMKYKWITIRGEEQKKKKYEEEYNSRYKTN